MSTTPFGPNPRGRNLIPAALKPPPPRFTAAGRTLSRRGHGKPLARHYAQPRAPKNCMSHPSASNPRAKPQSPPRSETLLPPRLQESTAWLARETLGAAHAAPRPPLHRGHAKTATIRRGRGRGRGREGGREISIGRQTDSERARARGRDGSERTRARKRELSFSPSSFLASIGALILAISLPPFLFLSAGFSPFFFLSCSSQGGGGETLLL